MPKRRYELNEFQWDKIKVLLPGQEGIVGVTAIDNRKFINAVLWILRSGSPWRDLPERYGDWKNTHCRFSRWSQSGIWKRVFSKLSKDLTMIVRAHQHVCGAKGKQKTRY